MRTLIIDSATEACSAALFEDGALVAGDYAVIGRGQHLTDAQILGMDYLVSGVQGRIGQ